jgi:hypothetical protein
VSGELAAFARLGALGHLDLQLVGVDEILARHAEAARSHLFDRASTGIAVGIGRKSRWILAALAGVALSTDAVHGDRQSFMRLTADRSIRHGAGLEPPDDRLDRLDLFDGNGRAGGFELHQAAQCIKSPRLLVDQAAVFLEDPIAAAATGVLKLVDRLGIKEMRLAFVPPLVVTA